MLVCWCEYLLVRWCLVIWKDFVIYDYIIVVKLFGNWLLFD